MSKPNGLDADGDYRPESPDHVEEGELGGGGPENHLEYIYS